MTEPQTTAELLQEPLQWWKAMKARLVANPRVTSEMYYHAREVVVRAEGLGVPLESLGLNAGDLRALREDAEKGQEEVDDHERFMAEADDLVNED